MESLADATTGKVEAADGEAEKKKKKEDTQPQPYTRNEVLQQRLQHRTRLVAQRGCATTRLRACSSAIARGG